MTTTLPVPPHRLALNAGHLALAVCRAVPVAIGDGDVPDRLIVVPAGAVTGVDGRSFRLDDPDAVVARFRALGRDLPVDIEHSTHLQAPAGNPAPAIGWITALAVEAGALQATVSWNAAGRELIASRAYRYISPAFIHDPAGRVVALRSVGLTNEPNLDLPALNRSKPMDRARLIALLGLAAGATDLDIEQAIASSLALNRTRQADLQPDLTLYVPKADLEAALNRATSAETRLSEIQRAADEAAFTALVDGAVTDGKIAPASREHYVALCRAGQADAVKTLIGSLPKLGAVAPSKTEGQPGEGAADLDASQLAICRNLGIAPKDFLATGRA